MTAAPRLACVAWALLVSRAASAPPRVILTVLADDVGVAQVGFIPGSPAASGGPGGASVTPRLDGLAAAGARLSAHFTSFWCTPSRAAFLTGRLRGLLGIGSGAFKVLAMDQIMKLPFKVTTATSNFMIGVTAAASVGIYLKKGYLDPALVSPVALGVLAGAFVGAKLLPVAPVKLLRVVFLTAVSFIAVQMILKGLH